MMDELRWHDSRLEYLMFSVFCLLDLGKLLSVFVVVDEHGFGFFMEQCVYCNVCIDLKPFGIITLVFTLSCFPLLLEEERCWLGRSSELLSMRQFFARCMHATQLRR